MPEDVAGSQGDIGAAAAAAAGVPSSAAPAGAPASGTPSAPAAPPTGAAPTAPAAATPRQFQYAEDRSTWVPPHRLREATERQRQYERDLHVERQRVAALSGVQAPTAPVDPEIQAIRQQFERVYPGLSKLEAIADKLSGLKDFDPAVVTQSQEAHYETLGNQALARLSERAAEVFGGELSPMARQSLEMTFGAWVHGNPDLHGRYAMQDPKLFDEFFKEYTTGILDPYRRKVTTTTAPRDNAIRRLPRGGAGSSIPGPGPRSLQPADSEEYHGAAFRAMNQQ